MSCWDMWQPPGRETHPEASRNLSSVVTTKHISRQSSPVAPVGKNGLLGNHCPTKSLGGEGRGSVWRDQREVGGTAPSLLAWGHGGC